ncbi:hypothetical protein HK107_01335 [Parvularcula sp. ZS-1/3]|uniref:Uncharacterized protein n=1 Tax=Parvularcula mediterranea TaxID=2732508 RepID=A0A7Y3RJ18_9PROT|nr:hypothetical protein [Parvularcula mediterranea]NNU14965.1 hypothetical protein [Parvularcula mediterranea]
MTWPAIPKDVIDWIRHIGSAVNNDVTGRMVNQPNVRETSLDDAFINQIAEFSAPRRLESGAIVMLETHNVGGLRHWDRWEIADIAFLVHVSIAGTPLCQKIGLLQSKRLYPKNHDVEEDDLVRFSMGLSGLVQPATGSTIGKFNRKFEFTESCKFEAITKSDEQLERILSFNTEFGESAYYLLYHPDEMPSESQHPRTEYSTVDDPAVGARVVHAEVVSDCAKPPTAADLRDKADVQYWRLETWMADFLLTCRVGRQYSSDDTSIINRMIYRRSGPISAAVRINVDLPEESRDQK